MTFDPYYISSIVLLPLHMSKLKQQSFAFVYNLKRLFFKPIEKLFESISSWN